MQRLRQIAFVILFAGWMIPAFLAQNARERAATNLPVERARVGLVPGIEPPPAPADRVLTMLRTIAGLWFLIALTYAGVLTVRFRRTLLS